MPDQRASSIDMRELLRSILADENNADTDDTDTASLYFTGADTAQLFCYAMSEHSLADGCRAGYSKDPVFSQVWKLLKEGRDSVNNYRLKENLIWLVENEQWRLCVPNDESLQTKILFSEHDCLSKGHPGVHKTTKFVQKHYYWRTMHRFIKRYVETCEKCQRNKFRQIKAPGKLRSLPIPEARWNDVTMDFIVDLPKSNGYNAIWVIIDRLSKRGHFIPIKSGDMESTVTDLSHSKWNLSC